MAIVTTEWTPVDLGDVEVRGVLWGSDKAWVYGYRQPASGLVPYVAHVTDDGLVTAYDLDSRGRLSSVYFNSTQLRVCLGESPAELVLLGDSPSYPAAIERDEDFLAGDRVWMAGADGHDFYVAEWDDGRLTAGEAWEEDFPEGPGLRHEGRPQDLIVGSSDVIAFVAGRFSSAGGSSSVGLWTNSADGGPQYPGGWERVELDPAPDGFTQINSSSSPSFAGHADGRPVLFSHRHGQLDAPEVLLDPDHPQVLEPWTQQVALQSRGEGPQLWTKSDVGWAPRPLPPGRLDDAAVCTTSEMVWVVLDGRLWRPIG